MGICASCLGLVQRESHGDESTRLLDDDIYQPGYGYGGVSQSQRNGGPDPEDVKRERDALDGICQRTSDGVVDVWTVQQPYTSTAQRPKTSFSSRMPSAESAVTQVLAHSRTATPTQTQSPAPAQDQQQHDRQDGDQPRDAPPAPPAHQGEFGDMKYVAYPNAQHSPEGDPSTVPKHWGEVVMTSRKGKKAQAAQDINEAKGNGGTVFGVLDIK